MKPERSLYIILFFASLACLAYEILLTRIFSISLWYHFAFMVISVAMLGIGASGTVLSLFPDKKDLRLVPWCALLIGVSIPLCYLLANGIPFDPARMAWDRMQLLFIGLYSLTLSIPFFCFGLIITTAFSDLSHVSGRIYAIDLIGAGIGSLLALWLMSGRGPEQALFIVSGLLLLALVSVSKKTIKKAAIAFLIVDCALLVSGPRFTHPRISPYKPLSLALQFPGAELLQTYHGPYSRVDVFTSPAARSAPGLGLQYLEKLPEQIGIAVDAGDITAITDDRDQRLLAFLEHLPASLPYALSAKQDVLILDPGGGLPMLIAKRHGAINVFGVQTDPLVLQTVRERTRNFSFALTGENTRTGLGRAWLASRNTRFDIIDLSRTGSLPHAAFGFAEDYRYTVEAFQNYLEHLKPTGFLTMNLFITPPPRTELRLLATLAAAAEQLGIQRLPDHLAVIRSWDSLTIVMKRTKLTMDDIKTIKTFSRKKKFDVVYCPGIKMDESNKYVKLPGNEYFVAFQNVINPDTRPGFIKDYLFDIEPVSDENPFFHYYLNLKNSRAIYRMMGGKWQYFVEEGYLLPILFAQLVLVGSMLILLPVLKQKKAGVPHGGGTRLVTCIYFGALGLGFMFIEVSFIQRMVLVLENPPYAMSTVILGILCGAAAGSLLSERVAWLRNQGVLLLLPGGMILSALWFPAIMHALLACSLPIKIILAFLVVLPAGFFMGIPFPLGLSLLGKQHPGLIPWAWAVNGCCSVLAPVLTIMIALFSGFTTVMVLAAVLYLIAFFAAQKLKDLNKLPMRS